MKILFIHGFNSAGFGDKVNHLRKGFGDENIINPTLPPSPQKAIKLLELLVKNLKDDDFCIAGTSLGGYYAIHLAHKFNVKAILINPALKAYELMDVHIGKQVNYKTAEEYNFKKSYLKELQKMDVPFENFKNMKDNLYIYLDEDDELLDSKKTAKTFKGLHVKMFKGGTHRFEHMEELIADFQTIEKKINL